MKIGIIGVGLIGGSLAIANSAAILVILSTSLTEYVMVSYAIPLVSSCLFPK